MYPILSLIFVNFQLGVSQTFTQVTLHHIMSEDVSMNDANAYVEEGMIVESDKIKILPGMSSDGSAATFQIKEEDHTLGNSLRYMIMKNPEVEFCGYSIPHPSEAIMNLRIQTYGDITAIEAFRKGLSDLKNMCDHVEEKFRQRYEEGDFSLEEPL